LLNPLYKIFSHRRPSLDTIR